MSRERDEPDNVIHVSFGAERGRQEGPRPSEARPPTEPPPPTRRRSDPLAELYTRREVASLFGFTESRLRYWDSSGFLRPSGSAGDRRYYTFQDLISIRAAKGLLDEGVPMRAVRESVFALRANLPRVSSPLSQLRVVADGDAVLVRDDAHAFEPTTGQLVLDFSVDSLRADVVRVLHARPTTPEQRRTAYEHYLEGCRLDEAPDTYDQAEEAYRRALEVDPSLANALTNLGNLHYRRGRVSDAEAMYRRALSVDAEQPEALYNLGFLSFERGEPRQAIELFRAAIDNDPGFGDAHFNLAMAYEEVGRAADARPHWETYLEIEPEGSWAEIARRHLRG